MVGYPNDIHFTRGSTEGSTQYIPSSQNLQSIISEQ